MLLRFGVYQGSSFPLYAKLNLASPGSSVAVNAYGWERHWSSHLTLKQTVNKSIPSNLIIT